MKHMQNNAQTVIMIGNTKKKEPSKNDCGCYENKYGKIMHINYGKI
jgi:hypothetical protein